MKKHFFELQPTHHSIVATNVSRWEKEDTVCIEKRFLRQIAAEFDHSRQKKHSRRRRRRQRRSLTTIRSRSQLTSHLCHCVAKTDTGWFEPVLRHQGLVLKNFTDFLFNGKGWIIFKYGPLPASFRNFIFPWLVVYITIDNYFWTW